MWDPKYQVELDHYLANFDFIGQLFNLDKIIVIPLKVHFFQSQNKICYSILTIQIWFIWDHNALTQYRVFQLDMTYFEVPDDQQKLTSKF